MSAGTCLSVTSALLVAMAQPCFAQDPSTQPFQNPAADAPLRAGANSFAESQARALVEAQGYSQVSALTNDAKGIWRGTAMRDNRKVDISVDFRGHVVAQ